MHTTAVRRLTGNEHLNDDFATTWSEYELDSKTRALLNYASKLTEAPSLVNKEEIDQLMDAGWGEDEVWEATALISLFNFSGRMEAASGLPPDQIPERASIPEARES